ncbi:phage head morphogenesis protein [Thermosphaera sp.]
MNILLKPVPYEEAARFIGDKPAVGRDVFDRLLPELKARAFMISAIEAVDTLQTVRDLIAEIPRGADWNEQKAKIVANLSPWLVDDHADPKTREQQVEAAERRAETLMRLHGFQAYAAAQWQVMDRHRDAFPFWMYQTFEDSRVRPAHAALDGLVLPADHPFWRDHYPPWDWGCRCQVVPLTEEEALKAARARPGTGSGWSPGPETLKRLEETGMLDLGDGKPVDVRSPRQKAEETGEDAAAQFGWDPGDLRMPLAALKGRYDAATWAAFEAVAKATRIQGLGTLWQWAARTPEFADLDAARRAFADLGVRSVLTRAPDRWGKAMDARRALAHAAAIHTVFSDLVARFPNMPRSLDTFLAVDSKRGRAHIDGPKPWLSVKAQAWSDAEWRNILRWERKHRRRWGVERRRTQVADNFRHEYGHVLSTPQVMSRWRSIYSGMGKTWFRKRISEYAATNEAEGLAETFALCTRPGYIRGRLPSAVEDFIFKTMLQED